MENSEDDRAVSLSWWAMQQPDVHLSTTDLAAGDLLLCRSLGHKPHQHLISRISKSPYTHAGIYLGDEKIAHSVTHGGVKIEALTVDANTYIGVLRSQMGFTADRVDQMREFIDMLIARKTKYDWSAVVAFNQTRKRHFIDLMDNLRTGNARISAMDEFKQRDYFCSALVVAIWCVCGILGESKWPIYNPDAFSPGDLHRDVSLGWVLGYLVADGVTVPADDPLRQLTQWATIRQIEKEEAAARSSAARNSSKGSLRGTKC